MLLLLFVSQVTCYIKCQPDNCQSLAWVSLDIHLLQITSHCPRVTVAEVMYGQWSVSCRRRHWRHCAGAAGGPRTEEGDMQSGVYSRGASSAQPRCRGQRRNRQGLDFYHQKLPIYLWRHLNRQTLFFKFIFLTSLFEVNMQFLKNGHLMLFTFFRTPCILAIIDDKSTFSFI